MAFETRGWFQASSRASLMQQTAGWGVGDMRKEPAPAMSNVSDGRPSDGRFVSASVASAASTAAERLLGAAEREQAHRHQIENCLLTID
jgi:hypothetical protein